MAGTESQSALIVEVPEAEAAVARWRERLDENAAMGIPAHITVIAPFLPRAGIGEPVLGALERLFGGMPGFRFRLARTAWFGEQVLNLAISTVMLTALVGALYLLIRRAPRTWWLWGGGVTALFIGAAFILGPVYIEPLFNTYKPAPPGPVRDAVVAMARANGVPSDKIYIYNGSKQSNRYTANVSGLFGTARVAMSDTMFQQGADLAEVKGVVGHEMGHYVLNHAVRDAALFALIAMAGFFLVDRLYPWALKLTGAQGVGGIADPAGYPVLMILFAVLGLLATPLTNTVSRVAEAEADSFSLERVNEPDGMAKALVKTIAYRAATPSKLEEVIFYDHPSVGSRVRKAMDWKAAHPKTVAPPLGELPRSG